MPLIVLGLNHQTAPIPIREQFAFAPTDLPEALCHLVNAPDIYEAAILSTCNRTELLCNARSAQPVIDWLAQSRGRKPQDINQHLYCYEETAAAEHICRIAGGLDSMVLGETQILGQLRQAEQTARKTGTLGVMLNGLFQHAFAVGKEIRTSTQIGSNSVSLASASVRLAERIFPSVSSCAILFVGAGEMIELCVRHFASHAPRHMAVANRTLERSTALMREFKGEPLMLTDLPQRLADFDVIVTSTASSLPLIGKGMVERAMKSRRHRPQIIIDLAVPRDVEAEVGQLADVYLYSVDDLAEVVAQGVETRQAAVNAAERIIEHRTEDFDQWLAKRALVPTIRELRDHAQRLTRNELGRARKQLANGVAPETVLEEFAHNLTNKILHDPLQALNTARGPEQEELAKLIRKLYRLHDSERKTS